jgi:hypothetical protein
MRGPGLIFCHARPTHTLGGATVGRPDCGAHLQPYRPDPGFYPGAGLLNDLAITPLGIWLALRLIPPEVMQSARETAEQAQARLDRWGWLEAGITILVWVFILGFIAYLILR